MAAMEQEVNLVKDAMQIESIESHVGRDFYRGTLFGAKTTLAFSRWGKVAASATASVLIDRYQVDCLIFTGVCGGVAGKANIGDSVIADRLEQHDLDATPLFAKYQVPLTGRTFFTPNRYLLQQSQQAALADPQLYTDKLKKNFGINSPRVHSGLVASGDQFITFEEKVRCIQQDHCELLAIEMEGAAVAQICEEASIPFIVIRIVSDYADHKAQFDFSVFVNEVASRVTFGVVMNLFSVISSMKFSETVD